MKTGVIDLLKFILKLLHIDVSFAGKINDWHAKINTL